MPVRAREVSTLGAVGSSVEPALRLTCGDETSTFDDDELCALAELNTLYGTAGAKISRMLITETELSEREVRDARGFVEIVRAKLSEPLEVYDHGRGVGTVCFQHRPWYELVKRSGIRYMKPTPRYAEKRLPGVDRVVYAKGRSVKEGTPQTLGDVPPLASAVEKLARVVARASEGANLRASPRRTFEYF